jgi:hypothetical protein
MGNSLVPPTNDGQSGTIFPTKDVSSISSVSFWWAYHAVGLFHCSIPVQGSQDKHPVREALKGLFV